MACYLSKKQIYTYVLKIRLSILKHYIDHPFRFNSDNGNNVFEVDEMKLLHRQRRYNRPLHHEWVVGIYQRLTGQVYLHSVADRTGPTLERFIRERITPDA